MADLCSPYHALLGQPALAKFMAVSHHAYLKLKIPGPGGLIAVAGYYRRSIECSQAGSKLAESLVLAAEKRQLDRTVALAQDQPSAPAPGGKHPAGESSFQPAKDTKKIPLDSSDPSKFVVVGANLSIK